MTRRPTGSTAALAALMAVSAALACGPERRPLGPWRRVVLVTVDTLRADRLGWLGGPDDLSPHLDALARRGVAFERAYCAVPRTTQSLATLLTGRYPWRTKVRRLSDRLPDSVPTLAERFSRAGWRTEAVVAIPYLLDPQGLDRGFDRFDHFAQRRGEDVRAEEVVGRAIERLEAAGDRPLFLWVHLRDPHAPYWRHEDDPYADRATPGYEGPYRDVFHYWPVDERGRPLGGAITPAMRRAKGRLKFGLEAPAPADAQRARALYEGEIRYVDREIDRLVGALDDLEETLFVFTADHGESLGEHDFWFDHGEFLYDTCLRVPLLFAGPGIEPTSVKRPVSLVDVAPTIGDLIGVGRPDDPDGRSLASVVLSRAEPPAGRVLLAESGEPLMARFNPRFAHLYRGAVGAPPPPDPAWRLRAAVLPDGVKAILDPAPPEGPRIALFDPRRDPGETEDLAGSPEAASRVERLRSLLVRLARETADAGSSDVDPALWRRLAEQGYLGGSPGGG